MHEQAIFAGFQGDDLEKLDSLLEQISRNLSAFRAEQQRVATK